MIFDELWRAERRDRHKKKELHDRFNPGIAAAEKSKNTREREGLVNEYLDELDLIEEADILRDRRFLDRLKKLGLAFRIPRQPNLHDPAAAEDDNWIINWRTFNALLSPKAKAELAAHLRAEEAQIFEERSRWARFWINQIMIPMLSLLIAVLSLVLAFFRHK